MFLLFPSASLVFFIFCLVKMFVASYRIPENTHVQILNMMTTESKSVNANCDYILLVMNCTAKIDYAVKICCRIAHNRAAKLGHIVQSVVSQASSYTAYP